MEKKSLLPAATLEMSRGWSLWTGDDPPHNVTWELYKKQQHENGEATEDVKGFAGIE